MVSAGYKYVKISRFAMLDMKLWLQEKNICISFAPLDEEFG